MYGLRRVIKIGGTDNGREKAFAMNIHKVHLESLLNPKKGEKNIFN